MAKFQVAYQANHQGLNHYPLRYQHFPVIASRLYRRYLHSHRRSSLLKFTCLVGLFLLEVDSSDQGIPPSFFQTISHMFFLSQVSPLLVSAILLFQLPVLLIVLWLFFHFPPLQFIFELLLLPIISFTQLVSLVFKALFQQLFLHFLPLFSITQLVLLLSSSQAQQFSFHSLPQSSAIQPI